MRKILVFLAPSGSGKSTCAEYLTFNYGFTLIKLSSPLHELQQIIYQELNLPNQGQDGELLQFLSEKLLKLAPHYLFQKFKDTAGLTPGNIVNDDCRPHNYEKLKSLGATFIRINGPRRARDTDHSDHRADSILEWKSEIPGEYEISNSGSLVELQNQLDSIMEDLCLEKSI